MSAKWRALQHRHRYTYSAIVFPRSYIDSLNSFQSQHQSSSKFFTELLELVSLNSVYAQVNHAKKVASAFSELLANGDEDSVSRAARFYLEVLFCENSQPLHRTLVSTLAKSRKFQDSLGECFRNLCEEHSGMQQDGDKRFCVSRVALSIMGMPKLGYLVDVIRDCAILVSRDIVSSLDSVVKETNDLARPSPIVIEQCQEALSCLYYLLQRFPSKFLEDSSVMGMIVSTILSILKSLAFSRDCYVSAGVSFCASLQVCLNSEELGVLIFYGIFEQTNHISCLKYEDEFRNAVAKVPYQANVCAEIQTFSVLSRLCLIRGILTAIPRPVLNIPFSMIEGDLNGHPDCLNSGNSVKTILYDAILPELCNYSENPTDSHFNFHSLTVLQICLQQIKTSLVSNLTDTSCSYDPLPEEMGSRILRIMWTNLEDPLSQTVKQVHLIFDLFLEIQSSLCWSESSEKTTSYLQKIAFDLLHLGSRCKGRYVPLASLTKRLGAKAMLDMSPSLLSDTVQAYIDDDVCCAATSFLKCFLEHLRDECWSSDGIEGGYALYRGRCLPPVLRGLGSGISKLRSNLNTYALPVLFEIDIDSIFPMLAFISVWPSACDNGVLYPGNNEGSMELRVEQKVAIFISLFKVSRSLALIEGDINWLEKRSLEQRFAHEIEYFGCHAFVFIKGVKVEILVEWLVLALTHVDESLRVDAAEFIFLNPKTSSLPSHLELTLLKKAIPLNMRCSSTAFQMKWTSLFRKFFSRVRTALERQFKQGSWIPRASSSNRESYLPNGNEQTIAGRANDLFSFMKWLSCFLFFSCYPSAPYRRKIMAMDLFLVMLNVWSVFPSKEKSNETLLLPYNEGITLPDSVLLLVGSIIDSWDSLRESSFRILLHFPTPLPGISSEHMVGEVITWAKKLVCSSRVRESDAGALTLRLVFRKYVLDLGWIVRASGDVVCLDSVHKLPNVGEEICRSNHPVAEYLKSLIDWLNISVTEGERNLAEACKNSFVHGVLLALRYTFEELDWSSDIVLSSLSEMRSLLEKLLELVMRITSLALCVVSADAWYLPEDMDDMDDDDAFLLDVPDEADASTSLSELEDSKEKTTVNSRTSEQIVMVGCWLAMKEVSLLLGTITRKVPLPAAASDSVESDPNASIILKHDEVLDLRQLKVIGDHFLEVLLKMKHNGAIDKTRAGFTALCNRLLCSNDQRLCKLTESWMDQLMERMTANGQTVDDLLRRSAGIPAAFIALFLAEPEGSPKKLLPRALKWLIDVAERLLLNPIDSDCKNRNFPELPSTEIGQDTQSVSPHETNASEKASKIRDEGVIPTVHAFNVLRASFNDANLATDTSGFSAQAIIVSIRAFSSSYWEVRNSACLAYTALVRRMIGFLNVHKRESARRALTGLEFFHRYPALHRFLLDELKVATDSLDDGCSGNAESTLAKVVHPSLCPVLILLSRLKPSTIVSEAGDDLDPFLFMPFIRKCSSQSNLRIRVLASRALTGLVSNENLPSVILNIASGLPIDDNTIMAPESSTVVDVTATTQRSSYNKIHGILLQLISLLDTNCRNLADISKKSQILNDLVEFLGRCSWMAKRRHCSCPILGTSFLRVLGHMLSIVRTCPRSKSLYIIRNLLLDLSTECLDMETYHKLSYYDPTLAELRQQAAICYFNCVLQPFDEEDYAAIQKSQRSESDEDVPATLINYPFPQLQERLIRSLQDPCYEVRLSTLKWLFKFLKSTEYSDGFNDLSSHEIKTVDHWTKTNLQALLTELLSLEKNYRCLYYILKNLFAWNMSQFQKFGNVECTEEVVYIGKMNCGSVLQFWDKLISLYKLTKHAKTRETTLRCMGTCIKRCAVLYSSSIVSDAMMGESPKDRTSNNLEEFQSCIILFTDLISQHSAASEPVNMRTAAADSIIASGLLEEAEIFGDYMFDNQIPQETSNSHFEQRDYVNMYAHQILNIWSTCIMLLEDEDDEIRKSLAADVQKCFSSERTTTSSDARTQVEQVIGSSFEYLSSIFGHWVRYFDYLANWVLNTANYAASPADPVRRVFDKEIDNHHEEKLLISQTCCLHLEKLSRSKLVALWDTQWFINYLVGLRKRFFHQLIKFSDEHMSKHGGFDWIGGAGNHKDAFLPLYGNLLGFYSISNCMINGKTQISTLPLDTEVVEIGKIINPFLRNPLISNLYLLVVRIHKEAIDVNRDHKIPELGHEGIWEGFDPYFLLR
ncbi:thyroid adenoma-associated protein homolog [Cucurbita maxima]|uniref:Thyroid adenoma-associated protein homolog n=1 Tax=Cucurbita maxima TaxID=3661 RepID=A0A6J1J6K6_CUCMA|nr:thyroid adenoma-associated protein homolog [Cucurbita maxima]